MCVCMYICTYIRYLLGNATIAPIVICLAMQLLPQVLRSMCAVYFFGLRFSHITAASALTQACPQYHAFMYVFSCLCEWFSQQAKLLKQASWVDLYNWGSQQTLFSITELLPPLDMGCWWFCGVFWHLLLMYFWGTWGPLLVWEKLDTNCAN